MKPALGTTETTIPTVNTVIVLGVAIMGYTLIKKFTNLIGVTKSEADRLVARAENLKYDTNPFSPSFMDAVIKRMPSNQTYYLFKAATAQKLAQQIHAAFHYLYDDEAAAEGAIKQCNSQIKVSQLAKTFYQLYQTDLYEYLKKGSGMLPQSGLNSEELKTILNYVLSLPIY